ncbi:MAG: hypothetical protein CMB51_07145 [Euryarchaeota archaeon]|nr:hypothetical protein [Euryarchaeota archaeon]DAC18983.1 MAG TPA: hypothetical protein D7I06_00875 [Candidatus Poseidoniales archaeon]HII62140.1 WbqC family protein [Candidatus Poseidoniaceae archaeon]|tara:strand:- start:910 stop:1647 length:738 start_codon:yes stop_codon:yes gene_type:complete
MLKKPQKYFARLQLCRDDEVTICAISQSNYIPWKGYFHLIASADIFIFYDTVNYTIRDWRNRNKIMTPHGLQWITIPVGKNRNNSIEQVMLPQGSWRKNHLETISRNYSKAPFIGDLLELISPIYADESIKTLSQFNQQLIIRISRYLGIDTIFHNARDFNVLGDKVSRLINLCHAVDATTYLSGPAAKDYINDEFDEIEITLRWMEYGPYETYSQRYHEFSHHVSIVDTIAMLGNSAREHIIGK